MGLSARTPTTIKTYYYVPAVYSNKVIDTMKMNLVAWDSIDSEWSSQLTKGDTLYIPRYNTVTASEVVVGTKGTALNPFNTAGATLSIDSWYEAPVDIDYMTLKQTQVNPESIAADQAAYAIKVKMDTAVCTLFYGLGGYTASGLGSDGQTLTDDLLLEMVETLDEADVPRDGNRFLIIDPSAVVDLLQIDKFIAAQYTSIGAVNNGIIGKSPIYGCTVKVTNNLKAATTGSYGVLMHKKALAGVAQIQNSWTKEFEELHQRRYHCEALWGVAEVNDSFGIPFFTRKA